MTALIGAMRFQLQSFRASPEILISLAIAPLQTIIFMSLVQFADRPDLVGYAVLAPAIISMIMMAILESGEMISRDRSYGTLEALLTVPTRLSFIVLSRIAVVTCVSLTGIVQSWFVAGVAFGAWITIFHPIVFAATVMVTAFAMAGTATAMAAIFVLSRSARIFQNSMSYPLLLLGGTFIPVNLLPDWLQPFSRVIFLSWATDLLRASLGAQVVHHVAIRLTIILLLGSIMAAIGLATFRVILQRVRKTGEVGFA